MSEEQDLFSELSGASASSSEQLPRVLGKYKLTSKLGEGGMGQVYLAEHVELGEPVALKLLPQNLAEDASFVNRFREEARKLMKLSHSNIVQARHFDKEGSEFYLVMEYIDGGDLTSLLEKHPDGVDETEARGIILEITSAIKDAHRTTIHRDLSLNNILLSKTGAVKVSDFGLSEVVGDEYARSLVKKSITFSQVGFEKTIEGTDSRKASNIVGKVRYMSPQVHKGEEADRRNDIYALGIIIYELLTGRTSGMVRSIQKLKPEIAPKWQAIFDKCTADELTDRYQSIEELEADILKIGSSQIAKPKANSGKAVPILIALLVLALGGVVYSNLDLILTDSGDQKEDVHVKRDISDQSKPSNPLSPSEDSAVAPAAQQTPPTVRIEGFAVPEGGRLTVSNAPKGAQSSFESADTFGLPERTDASEDYIVQFTHPYYEPGTFTIPSREGVHQVSFKPVQLKLERTFFVNSSPTGAQVILDGETPQALGATPLEIPVTFVRQSGSETYQPLTLNIGLEEHENATFLAHFDSPKELPEITLTPLTQMRSMKIALPGEAELNMAYIPAGEFTAGSPFGEIGRVPASEKQRRVQIVKPFYIGVTEITRSQYRSIMGNDPNFYRDSMDLPAEQIVFPELVRSGGFLDKLTDHIQKLGYTGWEATLPTNDEWEYAARAGTETTFYNGQDISNKSTDSALDQLAVYSNTSRSPLPVGSKKENPWGLYDMLGNVFEWTAEGDLRGGSFHKPASVNRPAFRLTGLSWRQSAGNNFREYGFRVVLRPPDG